MTDLQDREIWGERAADVQFGPHDTDKMPLDWAAKGLTWLKANRPQVFADMMTEGVLGIEKRAGRR